MIFFAFSLTEAPHLKDSHRESKRRDTETHTKRDRANKAESPAAAKAISFSIGFSDKSQKIQGEINIRTNCNGK